MTEKAKKWQLKLDNMRTLYASIKNQLVEDANQLGADLAPLFPGMEIAKQKINGFYQAQIDAANAEGEPRTKEEILAEIADSGELTEDTLAEIRELV